MDTREEAGTFDLSVHGISQQPGTEDALHVPAEDTHMEQGVHFWGYYKILPRHFVWHLDTFIL